MEKVPEKYWIPPGEIEEHCVYCGYEKTLGHDYDCEWVHQGPVPEGYMF